MRIRSLAAFAGAALASSCLYGVALAQPSVPHTELQPSVDPADASAFGSVPGKTSSDTSSQVMVTGSRVRSLEQFTPTGSRLNLSAKDTPATLDVVTSQTITTRGYLTAEEAADSLPGVTSGGTPGDLVNFHIRGFSGDEIQILHNGIYVGPSDLIARPNNTYNLESIQILKGPASVLYGQGAIGGAINIVNKAVPFGAPEYDGVFSYGSYNTVQLGTSVDGSISPNVGARLGFSYLRSNNYINRAPSDSLDAAFSMLWRPNAKLEVQLSVNYLQDHPFPYYGDPLLPMSEETDPLTGVVKTSFGYTLDKRTSSTNYNVSDYIIESHQIFPQILIKYKLNDYIELSNFLYFFKADRRWRNAETYLYDTSTRDINRDRFFVDHNQDIEGDQGDLTVTSLIFGLDNKFNIGYDYSHLDFRRTRGFPDNDEVSVLNPNAGSFIPGLAPGASNQPVAGVSPTYWNDPAVFLEDSLTLKKGLKLVTGTRYDYLILDRQNESAAGVFNPATSFKRIYDPFTYRVGLVYDINKHITPYLSLTTGQDPVSSNIFIVNSSGNYSLSRSKQVEVGVKVGAPGDRADVTFAVYDIERRNVLTTKGEDVAVTIGSEYSKGAEISSDLRVTNDFMINANASYDKATFGKFNFTDAVTGNAVNANRLELPDAPQWVANIWGSYTHVAGLPLELGGGVQYVGDRAGDYGNTERLLAYTLLNAYVTYSLNRSVDLTLRISNLTNQSYAQSTDINYERQIVLGRPRYLEFDLHAHF